MAKEKTLMDTALSYLTYRARTEVEMKRYLDEKNFGEFEVDQTVERLKELGLIDDLKFAKDFVETRLASKPISKSHLRQQLKGHFVPEEYIEEALKDVSEENEFSFAVEVAEKYLRQTEGVPADKRKERVLRRLCSRGFQYDVAKAAFETALAGEEHELD